MRKKNAVRIKQEYKKDASKITITVECKVKMSFVDCIKLAILKGAFPALEGLFRRIRGIK